MTPAKTAQIPYAMVQQTGSVSNAFANTTYANVSYNNVVSATSGMYSASAPDRVCAPIAGVYEIKALARIDSNATGVRTMRISRLPSGAFLSSADKNATTGGFATEMESTAVERLGAGDCVGVRIWQNSGSSLGLDANGTTNYQHGTMSAYLQVAFLGR